MLVGAVAVAALGAALYGVLRRAREPQLAAWAIRRGTTVFGVATAANVFVGMLFLLAQPKTTLIRLVGGDAWAMALLALGIVLGIAAAGLALLALGAKNAVRATWAQVGPPRRDARGHGPAARPGPADRAPRRRLRAPGAGWSPSGGRFAVFVVLLVAAVAAIAWMARALARGTARVGR